MATKGKGPRKGLKQESSKAKLFCDAYLAMGVGRSLEELSKMVIDGETVGKRYLEQWSSKWGWVERARKYDEEQLKRKQKLRQEQIDTMNIRHIKIAIEQQEKAIEVIDRLRLIKGKGGLSSVAAVNLLKLAVDLERLANNAATEQLAITGKDEGPLDIEVTTFWGRGTDPRRKSPDSDGTSKEETEEDDEDLGDDEEFGADVPEDDEDE